MNSSIAADCGLCCFVLCTLFFAFDWSDAVSSLATDSAPLHSILGKRAQLTKQDKEQSTKHKAQRTKTTEPNHLVSINHITLAEVEIVSEFTEVIQGGRQPRSVSSRNVGRAGFCGGRRVGVGFSSFCSDVAGDNGSRHSKSEQGLADFRRLSSSSSPSSRFAT